jgi:histidinol-phosphate aminotransferase
VSTGYQRPFAAPGGLRLHLNENTGGCSPRVLDAIRALEAEDASFYPEYQDVVQDAAAYLAVPPESVVLTNGLDEGILATVLTAARDTVRQGGGLQPESVVPLPAFDMYGVCTAAVGAKLVTVPPRDDLRFAVDGVLNAVGPATRVVFITSPNNPTGVRVERGDIAKVAAAVPSGALVFVDEAYHDFCGDTAVPLLDDHANVIIGRTFAKGHGLAALRVGCVIGRPEILRPFRDAIPPYSLNVCAAVGLRAALRDAEHLRTYVEQVRASREMVYRFCERHDLEYWESGANFVLVRIGGRAAELVRALASRGIFVRDRSNEPGCAGCIRITAGVLDHTRRCLTATEEILCAAE